MEKWMQAIIIIAVCVIVVFIVRFRKAGQLLLNFGFRVVVGGLVLAIGNKVLHEMHMECMVGINSITLLTCGFLGFPGAVGLFMLRILLFL